VRITRKGWGEAPETADRVFIQRLPGGLFTWSGSIGHGDTAIFTTGDRTYPLAKDAEAAAVTWARAHFVAELIVEMENP
jgi:hypothetical protein